ncbi:MAG TPA: tRNA pseudouridine(55) synthase TruB [Armatimonadota bacterium]|nr:tRNA pseudouridine(55) synthase TruB [Armatimonadota bacterium]
MNGILNLHKPTGPTSHDCVARVRHTLGTRRVGHAGTLDPLASGVLVIGVGHGTRILEYLQGLPKVYHAHVVLGLETDSQDVTGATVAEADASGVTEEQVRRELSRFQGDLLQLQPMVSALKVGGKKLYELARRGETVEREPRPVTVYHIELLGFTPGPRAEAEFRMRCSAGTYVRTICHDLGQALRTGGAMKVLAREAVGPFRLDDAVPLAAVQPATPLLPLAQALGHLPSLVVDESSALRLAHGQFIPAPEETPDGPVRVLGQDGRLLAMALVRGHGEGRLLNPEKVFVSSDAASVGA